MHWPMGHACRAPISIPNCRVYCDPRRTPRVPANKTEIFHMNKTTLKGNWNVIKGRLRKKYAQLTDDDLAYIEGSEEELIGRLQKRTGETRERIEELLDENE